MNAATTKPTAGALPLLPTVDRGATGLHCADLAHDFNNVLASITGYLQLVRRLSTDAQQRVLLGKALDAAERGRQFTSRLVAPPHSDAGGGSDASNRVSPCPPSMPAVRQR